MNHDVYDNDDGELVVDDAWIPSTGCHYGKTLLSPLTASRQKPTPHKQRYRAPLSSRDFTPSEQSRIIEMAWEDRTPFEAIEALYGLTPAQLVHQMRAWLKPSSFRLWRQRMNGRATKHASLRPAGVNRAYCPTQYKR